MKLEVRERPFDLYAMMVLSTMLVLVIVIIPDVGVLRIVLGLPFILFFPGYALISALYPEKPVPLEKEEEDPYKDGSREEKDGEEVIEKKGLDNLERIALALGLSIAITPLLGLILNYTYEWDPDHLGIRLIPILVTQYGFIMVTSAVAVRRRGRVPVEDRFEIVVDIKMPADSSRADKVLTVGIVVMMVLSVGMLVYIIVVPREGEAFTEFYVLGSKKMADDYPRNFLAGEAQSIFVGVGNHEHRDMNYTLVLSIDNNAENMTVPSLNDLTISTLARPSMEVEVDDGATIDIPCNFTIEEPGSYKLRLLLFRGDREYRDLHLWVRVFSEGYLISAGEKTLEFFVAGPGMGPFEPDTAISGSEALELTLGLVNSGTGGLDLNISIYIGSPDDWAFMEGPPIVGDLTPFRGGYFNAYLAGGSSITLPVELTFSGGEHLLVFTVSGPNWTGSIQHDLMVGE